MALSSDFDLSDFWEEEESEDSDEDYVDLPVTPEEVAQVERELGYKLPAAYVELMESQNGGIPLRTNHRTKEPTSWAKDHVSIVNLSAIGHHATYALCGESGSKFWMTEWDYPDIGIYFATCPSGGHDLLCLDYRACGPQGEPSVVHVDQGEDFKITAVAPSFESFIRGLEDDSAFDDDDE